MARVLRTSTCWGEKSAISPHVAAFEGDLVLLESLVMTEYGANLRDQNGATPLHHATFGGYLDCVRFLLENGAVVDAVDRQGICALHIACFQGHLPVVKALLLYGAQINLADKIGETALHKATLYDHNETVAHLLSNKAEVDARTNENKTSLQLASQLGYEKCVKNLLEAGAIVNLADSASRTALHISAIYGYEKCSEHLLAHKANFSLCDATGATALHNAAFRGYDKIVEQLCKARGIENAINTQDDTGVTALHHVCFSGAEECLTHLLAAPGIKLDVQDQNKYTALHLACFNGHSTCVKSLLESFSKISSPADLPHAISMQTNTGATPLHLACLEGHVECVNALLEKQALLDVCDNEKSTALHKASFKGHEECVIALTKANCNVNVADEHGDTPLHKCAFGGHDECVDVLIQHNADLDAKDHLQAIPAHNAALQGHVSCLDKLVSETNINADDCKGRTPLHLAALHGQLEAVQYLMTKANVDINLEDAKGHSPLYLAIENAYESIVHDLIIEDAIVSPTCVELVSQPRVLISQATIDSFLEEKNNRAKMKNLQDPKTRTIIRQLVALFNSKPKKGLTALIEKGVVGKSPPEIAEFLHNNEQLNKQSIGELLGEEEFHDIRRAFTDYMHFDDMDFEPALRLYLSTFRLPGEAQKIDRLMECFADRFYADSKEASEVFADKDACYILAFAVIMLNTDAHNPAIKKQNKMTKQQFITNNRGINNGNDVDHAYLERIYDGINEKPIEMKADASVFTNAEKKGFLTKQGGRVKTWKKRWFVLTNNNLYYFRSDKDEKNPLGWIPLENLTITIDKKASQSRYGMVIQASPPGQMIKSCKLVDGQPVPGSHSRFVIAASTAEEMQGWYDILTSGTKANPHLENIQNKLKSVRGKRITAPGKPAEGQ